MRIKMLILIIASLALLLGFSTKPNQRALKLHIDSIVVDSHNDTLMHNLNELTWLPEKYIVDELDMQIDLKKMRAGNLSVGYFAAYTSPFYGYPDRAASRTLAILNAARLTEERSGGVFKVASSYEEIEKALLKKQLVAVPTMEGAYSVTKENGTSIIDQFYDVGIKAIGFTWNYSNELAEGIFKFYGDGKWTKSSGGLTDLGIEAVQKMNSLGMIIDISHLSENSFWGVIDHTKAPIIASHTGVMGVKVHERNLTDEQLLAIKKTGGVVGIVYHDGFIHIEGETLIKHVVDHMEYAIKLIGIDHVALGSDFDGAYMPTDLPDASKLYLITEELLNRGYSQFEIKKLLGQNHLRVIKEVERLADAKISSDGVLIKPNFTNGEIIKEKTLTANISEQDNIKYHALINGREFKVEKEKDKLILNLPKLREKFYMVSFIGVDENGLVTRETRYVKLN